MKERKNGVYTPEVEERLLSGLRQGLSIRAASEAAGIYDELVFRWRKDREGFEERFREAREIGLDREADEIKELADNPRIGKIVTRTEIGRACSVCNRELKWNQFWRHTDDKTAMCPDATAKKVSESKVVTSDAVERSKLQIGVRQWRLERMLPRKYGNRVGIDAGVTSDEHGLVTYEQLDIMIRARRATTPPEDTQ
jgi:hypothetical protein